MPADAAVSTDDQRTQRIHSALGRYRVIAYVVGCGLLLLCVATVLDWGFHEPALATVVGPLHGVLYMVYLGLATDLALKARWSLVGTLLVLVSGTIPFLSFVAERQVTRRVREGRGL